MDANGTDGTSRRGFFAAAAGAAAAGLLPGMAAAMGTGFDGCRWDDFRERLAPALRAAYLAEVEALTDELRPRFAAGEVGDWGPNGEPEARYALEGACAERFGCGAVEKAPGSFSYSGDTAAALRVLGASPSAEEEVHSGFYHIGQAAQSAVAVDVLRVARQRGWVQP